MPVSSRFGSAEIRTKKRCVRDQYLYSPSAEQPTFRRTGMEFVSQMLWSSPSSASGVRAIAQIAASESVYSGRVLVEAYLGTPSDKNPVLQVTNRIQRQVYSNLPCYNLDRTYVDCLL